MPDICSCEEGYIGKHCTQREYLGTLSYFNGSLVFSKDVIMIAGAWTARIPANAKMEQPATTNQDYVIA